MMNAISSPSSGFSMSSSMMSDAVGSMKDEKPAELAKQFESLFVSMLMKEMRQTSMSGGEGLFPGDSSDTLGGIFDMFMGQHIAENGGIGMADSIELAIQGRKHYGM